MIIYFTPFISCVWRPCFTLLIIILKYVFIATVFLSFVLLFHRAVTGSDKGSWDRISSQLKVHCKEPSTLNKDSYMEKFDQRLMTINDTSWIKSSQNIYFILDQQQIILWSPYSDDEVGKSSQIFGLLWCHLTGI